MKQLIDNSGNLIAGLYKKPDGSIVVKNEIEFQKAISFKNKIDSMQDELNRLSVMVSKLMENKQ